MNDWAYFEKKILFTKHKYVNFQIGWNKESTSIFNVSFRWDKKVDHAGFSFNVNIWKFYFIFDIYDNRHWCELCNRFKEKICYLENHEEIE